MIPKIILTNLDGDEFTHIKFNRTTYKRCEGFTEITCDLGGVFENKKTTKCKETPEEINNLWKLYWEENFKINVKI
jgi:hypothetical protein